MNIFIPEMSKLNFGCEDIKGSVSFVSFNNFRRQIRPGF